MDKKEKLINRLFFSTPILLITSAIFLISMFASGWYVFTLKDREVELEKAAQWIERSKEIFEDTKKSQVLLNKLKIDLNNATAEKDILLNEITINKEKLARTLSEEQQKRSELDSTKQQIKINQKRIADDQTKIKNLNAMMPNLEQGFENLKSKNEDLERNVIVINKIRI